MYVSTFKSFINSTLIDLNIVLFQGLVRIRQERGGGGASRNGFLEGANTFLKGGGSALPQQAKITYAPAHLHSYESLKSYK